MRGWLQGSWGLAPAMVPALLCLHQGVKGCPVRLGHLPWQDSAVQGDEHGEKLGREDGVCGDGTGALQGAAGQWEAWGLPSRPLTLPLPPQVLNVPVSLPMWEQFVITWS